MKKIALSMALCASASFSPVNAQMAVNGTAAIAGGRGTVTSATIVPMYTTVALSLTMEQGSLATMGVQIISINGTILLGGGFVDKDLVTKIKGASCEYVPPNSMLNRTTYHKASCRK